MARTISYSIVGMWQLPETVKFAAEGRIQGYFTSLEGGGEWQTSTYLGAYNRNAAVSQNLSITPQAGRTIVNYALRGEKRLPIGLYLNPTTGNLSGNVSLWPREANEPEFVRTPIPTWNTATDLGVKNEADTVNVSVNATANLGTTVTYVIRNGALPWGLYMGRDGAITGTISAIEPSEEYVEKIPKPTISGNTATYSNGQAVNYTITAAPPASQTLVNFAVHSGTLPWGLRLNPTTGVISGTITIPATGMPATTTYNFSVRVTSSSGAYQNADFSISIS